MTEKKKKEEKVPVRKKESEIVTWRPSDIFPEFDRVFEDFRRGFEDLFNPERRWTWPIKMPKMTLPEVRAPFCDLVDEGKEYRFCAEIPGIPKEQIEINIDKDGIEISAETKSEKEEKEKEYVSRERSYSRFYRNTPFPEEVIPEKAQATYENGVLEVTIPKRKQTKIKKHKVKIK